MNHVEVLDRVCGLLLLPNTELATTKQFAQFYGVSQEVIRDNIRRYKEELEDNGLVSMQYRKVIVVIGDRRLGISTCGNNVFSKRAILNIGMLLRDSVVAKEVRELVIANISDDIAPVVVEPVAEEAKLSSNELQVVAHNER